jgi:early secretory antigenic target protein ESAT-6
MPDTPSIAVSFAALETAAAETINVAHSIASDLGDLERSLLPIRASWSGAAAADFDAIERRWRESAATIQRVLEQIGQALLLAGANYAEVERVNSHMWMA